VAGVIARRREGRSLRALHYLWPLLGYNALVLLSTLQPAFRSGVIYDAPVLVPIADLTAWPASAQPEVSLRELWLFNALVLPAFNLLFCVESRRLLHRLLLVLAVNALGLSVFGTLQKLSQATGLFFDAVASPNKTFFASFIYHNHWGAFVLLMTSVALGLLADRVAQGPRSGQRHSPVPLGIVGAVILAVSAPLSTSRSATVLITLLLTLALLHGLRGIFRRRATRASSSVTKAAALVIAALLSVVAIYELARPFVSARAADTREQLAAMRATGSLGSRAVLYHDTWRMAAERPAFGWGLGSFPVVFQLYNTQESADRLPVHYVDAHSDWLQSLAETGFVGTALLGLLVLLPALTVLRHRSAHRPLPLYLLIGCTLVLLYAWVEFPFGCPAVIAAFWAGLFSAVRLARLAPSQRPSRG
jgi:O-antigen ligase